MSHAVVSWLNKCAEAGDFDSAIRRFDLSRPSQPVAQPERVGPYRLKVPYFIGFPCGCPKSLVSRNRQSRREFAEVSSPNRRNSRFRGDDWQRPVRSPLIGGVTVVSSVPPLADRCLLFKGDRHRIRSLVQQTSYFDWFQRGRRLAVGAINCGGGWGILIRHRF